MLPAITEQDNEPQPIARPEHKHICRKVVFHSSIGQESYNRSRSEVLTKANIRHVKWEAEGRADDTCIVVSIAFGSLTVNKNLI